MQIFNSDFNKTFKLPETMKTEHSFFLIIKIPATKIDFIHIFFQA